MRDRGVRRRIEDGRAAQHGAERAAGGGTGKPSTAGGADQHVGRRTGAAGSRTRG